MGEIDKGNSSTRRILGRLWDAKGYVALAALVVGFLQWWYPRAAEPARSAQVEIVASSPLVAGIPKGDSDWKLTYKGQAVASPYQTVLRFTNSGEIPIVPDQIEIPLTVKWDAGPAVSCSVLGTEPSQLRVAPVVEGSAVRVSTGLLNRGNSFVIQIITEEPPKNLRVSFRSIGIDAATVVSRAIPSGQSGASSGSLSIITSIFLATFIVGVPALIIGDLLLTRLRRRLPRRPLSSRCWRNILVATHETELGRKLLHKVDHHFSGKGGLSLMGTGLFDRPTVLASLKKTHPALSDEELSQRFAALQRDIDLFAQDALYDLLKYPGDTPSWWNDDVRWYFDKLTLPRISEVGARAFVEQATKQLSSRYEPAAGAA